MLFNNQLTVLGECYFIYHRDSSACFAVYVYMIVMAARYFSLYAGLFMNLINVYCILS